jgi:hypothetical protein
MGTLANFGKLLVSFLTWLFTRLYAAQLKEQEEVKKEEQKERAEIIKDEASRMGESELDSSNDALLGRLRSKPRPNSGKRTLGKRRVNRKHPKSDASV